MQTLVADIWDLLNTHKIVIPVNFAGPMGRGLAYQAKTRFPSLEVAWKGRCKKGLAGPGKLVEGKYLILLPVKYHYAEKANLKLIEDALAALSQLSCAIALPQIGCGFGERSWEKEVEPLVLKYLGDKENITLVIPPEDVGKKYAESFKAGIRKDKRWSDRKA